VTNLYGQCVLTSRRIFSFRFELAALLKCLLQANDLESLRLSLNDCKIPEQSCWNASPKTLDLQVMVYFPAVQELVPLYSNYDLTEMHCNQWVYLIDRKHLRLLDIGCRALPIFSWLWILNFCAQPRRTGRVSGIVVSQQS
jgi:hypothetical protein